ncbi:hypothetical protein SCYAM73S_05908 [Streptomyces cyaneofuscatus]
MGAEGAGRRRHGAGPGVGRPGHALPLRRIHRRGRDRRADRRRPARNAAPPGRGPLRPRPARRLPRAAPPADLPARPLDVLRGPDPGGPGRPGRHRSALPAAVGPGAGRGVGAVRRRRGADRRAPRRPPHGQLPRHPHGRPAHPPRRHHPARQPHRPDAGSPQPLRRGPGPRVGGVPRRVPADGVRPRRPRGRHPRPALRRPVRLPGRGPDRAGGDHRRDRPGPARARALPAHRGAPHPDGDRPADRPGRRGARLPRRGP